MKKQILSLAVVALLAFAVQSCEKKEPKPGEDELTLGNKVDTLTTDIEEVKDSTVIKAENAAANAKEASQNAVQDVKDATKKTANDVENAAKKTATDVKEASQKAATKAEAAAKAAKDGTVKTAKDVNEALKK